MSASRCTIAEKFPGWKVLVVDEHSMRVISAAVGMYDIMERKITLVESIDKKRAPFQDMGAIYLVEPSAESVRKIIADFSGAKPLYGSDVFLFFLGRLSDRLLDEIKRCKPLLKRIKALSEVNVDFLAKEERAFNLDLKDSFTAFYLRKSMTPIELKIAEKLVTVCATLNEYPHIRYRQSSGICTSLANVFHLKMDEFVSQNPSWWYHGGSSSKSQQAARRERGTLLLLDRADDCLTPLMHDFTYQSMVHDLLPMDGDRITVQTEKTDDPTKTEPKDVLLDEKDSVWVELRGKHIAAVIETLSERIREIMNSSTGSTLTRKAGSGGGNMSLSEMAAALKALPEYREVLSKLSQHMHLAHQCMDKFTRDKLLELSEFEQTLATGKDEDGRSPKLTDIIDAAERLLMDMRDATAKLRLILILTVSQGGLRQQDRRRLVNAAELSRQEMRTLNSLEILGLSTIASSDKKNLISLLKL
jgi:syntaxin-binding protein 1